MAQANRYLGLDALRGAAAILVVVLHLSSLQTTPVPSAYLAVDLFFGLSGFVLAHSYGPKLVGGYRVWADFMRRRFLRLWPLYALGTALGLSLHLYQSLRGWISDGAGPAAITAAANLVFLPSPWPLPSAKSYAFPFNPPSWSLFCEMAVNILFAYLMKARRWRAAAVLVLALSAIGVAALAWTYQGLLFGNGFESTYLGLIRAAFSFFAGVLLYDRRAALGRLSGRLPPVAAMGLLALICVLPGQGLARTAIDLVVVMLAFPALVLLSSGPVKPGPVARLCHALGVASYPLYVIHWPLLRASELAFAKLNAGSIHDHPKAMALTVAAIWLAALALGYGDEWQRKRRRGGRPGVEAAAQAAID